MMEGTNAFGFVVYLLEIFLPGIGFGELFGAWKKQDRLVDKFALAFGTGLAFDTLVLVIRTSGLRLGGLMLLGLEPATVYFAIVVGIAALFAGILRRRKFDFLSSPTRVDAAVFLLTVVQATIVLLWLAKYPIFPGFQSQDYGAHVTTAQGLVSGSIPSVPQGILYYGINLQLASAFLLVGGEGLVTAQQVMAILVVLSPPLVYLATTRLFSTVKGGLVAAAIYSFAGTIWFNSVFTTGLFANFFGILAMLFFIVVYLDVAERVGSWKAWVAFFLGLVMIYFSHFSSATIFPAIVAVPLLKFLEKRSDARRYAAPTIVSLLPAGVGYLVFTDYANSVLTLAAGGPAFIVGGTPLSSALSSVPLLSFMALETSNDVAFVVLLLLALISAYRVLMARKAVLFVPLVWFLAIALISFFAVLPTRLAFSALLPFNFMAAYGLASVIPSIPVSTRRKGKGGTVGWQRLKVLVVVLVLLVPVAVNSWSQFAVTDALTSTSQYSQVQQEVYSAIYWLKDNTPANSTYLSVTDWRFAYTGLFYQRTTNVVPISGERSILNVAKAQNDTYLIVTFYDTFAPAGSYLRTTWNTITQGSNFTLVYKTEDVKIFRLKY